MCRLHNLQRQDSRILDFQVKLLAEYNKSQNFGLRYDKVLLPFNTELPERISKHI